MYDRICIVLVVLRICIVLVVLFYENVSATCFDHSKALRYSRDLHLVPTIQVRQLILFTYLCAGTYEVEFLEILVAVCLVSS